METAVTATYDNIVERGFGRAEENESDEQGVALANKIGYAPNGLVTFLTTLKDRNKESTEKRGLFASHPEMQERLDKHHEADRLTEADRDGHACRPRFAKNITYKPVPLTAIATVTPGSAGLTGGDAKAAEKKPEEKKAEEPKKSRFGLGKMLPTERRREEAGAGHGFGRRARSGSREGLARADRIRRSCAVKIAAADIAAFKKEGGLP